MLRYISSPRPPAPVRTFSVPRPVAPRPRTGTVTNVVVVHHWYTPIYQPFHYYMPFPYYGHVSILGFVLVLLVLILVVGVLYRISR